MDDALAKVEVEAITAGQLTVRWESSGDGHVDIGVGSTPDATSHVPTLRIPCAERSARLIGLPEGRVYVSLTYRGHRVVAAERRLGFDGVPNFRDLGGYPTATGGWTRWGRLFRSSSLHKLTADDLTAYDRLGIQRVFDLRHLDERERRPGPRPSTSLPISNGASGQPDPAALRDHVEGEAWLADYYRALVDGAAATFGMLLTSLAAPDSAPAVFHCAAGKDRTGLAAAFLLTWLGVDRETVLDDYELTGRYLSARTIPAVVDRFVANGASRAATSGVLSSPRWAMARALERVDVDYGGIEAYLRGPAGVPGQALDQLRRRLVN